MNNNVIITISRQFGSNGREIARKLAEYLDIGYYNKEIMRKIAIDMGISPDFFEDMKQNDNGMYQMETKGLFGLRSMAEISVNSQIYERAAEMINEIAKRESAVIVGRCADHILRNDPDVISVFCYCDLEKRIRWSIDEYKVPAKQAQKILQEKDQKRARFYEFNTDQKWGDPRNYHLMINTSKMSTDDVVHLLANYYDDKKGITSFKGAFMDQYINDKSNE